MPTEFVQYLPNFGFDRETPTGGPGVVIPYKGSTTVLLDSGKGLKLVSSVKNLLTIDEIKDQQVQRVMVEKRDHGSTDDKILDLVLVKSGSLRIFRITANALVGIGAKVEAVNPKTGRAEAALKVIVLKEKPVKIAIRPVQIHDENGDLVNSSRMPFDAKALLAQMNAIWKPQANVVFSLSKTDAVAIKPLKPGMPADISDEAVKSAFIEKKDPDAALTFFMVKRAVNRDSKDLGVINSEAGFSLISDDRLDTTMAHEAGHFLGSLSESGKFSSRYGHQGTSVNLLMRAGGSGPKIPFHQVVDFNKGYRA
jgi:hypothetical protein